MGRRSQGQKSQGQNRKLIFRSFPVFSLAYLRRVFRSFKIFLLSCFMVSELTFLKTLGKSCESWCFYLETSFVFCRLSLQCLWCCSVLCYFSFHLSSLFSLSLLAGGGNTIRKPLSACLFSSLWNYLIIGSEQLPRIAYWKVKRFIHWQWIKWRIYRQ